MRPPQRPPTAGSGERPGATFGPWPVEVAPDPPALAILAARRIVADLSSAQRRRGRATIALAGGHTPRRLYQLLGTLRPAGLHGPPAGGPTAERLAPEGSAAAEPALGRRRFEESRIGLPPSDPVPAGCPPVDWHLVEFFWTDERCVPPDDHQSNYRLARETLLGPLGVPESRVHRIAGELPPEAAASRYADELDRVLGGPPPRLDLALLGLGPEGHTASLFPGDRALVERLRTVVAARAPHPPLDRVTLTLPVLNAARRVLFLVSGSGKSEVVHRILAERTALPAARLQAGAGRVRWLLDRPAAASLPSTTGVI